MTSPGKIAIRPQFALLLLGPTTLATFPAAAQSAAPVPGPCVEDVLPSGALSLICIVQVTRR